MKAEKNVRWFMTVTCAILWLFGWSATSFAETDVTTKVQVVKGTLAYDRAKLQSYLDVSLKNISQDVLLTPIKVVINSISTTAVTVANADGVTPEGKPYFSYAMDNGMLIAGMSTASKRWIFSNPKAVKFSYTTNVLGIIPEAAATIGSVGGVVEVSNPSSPIFGVSAEFAENTLVDNTVVTMNLVDSIGQLPTNIDPISNIINFGPSGEFVSSVIISFPIDAMIAETNIICLASFNETTGEWELEPPIGYNTETHKIIFAANHFSNKVLSKINDLFSDESVSTNFNINNDSFIFNNTQQTLNEFGCTNSDQKIEGICAGMALFSGWFFENERSLDSNNFLKCIYDTENAVKIACDVHYSYYRKILLPIVNLLPEILQSAASWNHIPLKSYLIYRLKMGEPIPLAMLGIINNEFPKGHEVLVYGWEKTDDDSGGFFSVYDVNDNTRGHKIYYSHGKLTYNDHTFDKSTTLLNVFSATASYIGANLDSFYDSAKYVKSDSCNNEPPATTYRLPDTGQTQSYTNTFGEDHDYLINPPSYTDNHNGTVTDNVTGLMWQQQGSGQAYTWYQAAGVYDATYNPTTQNVCQAQTTGGYSDWRLPTKKELVSIVDYGRYSPNASINPIFNVVASCYWSSTTWPYASDYAWYVNFNDGPSSKYFYKYYSFYVRCVRGGQ